LCGIEQATGDYIVTMDDDLQHQPEDILKLMEKSNHDVVIAKFLEKKHSLFKKFVSHIKGYFDQIILGKPKSIKLSAFRLINSETAKLMFKRRSPYPFIPALLFDITDDLVNVEVDHYPRHDGEGNYTLLKMIRLFGNLIINNSSFLLRMMGYVGVTVAFLTSFMAVVLLIKKIFLDYVLTGWTSIVLLVLFFGGLTLLTLGVIGEYLVRIIATTEERPSYYIRKIKQRNGH
jgi:dolichol-phosphate mannosyltransferase/undecaprenyl-phosphate 4-deoxy-4-formamido-L-arabinose transferase